MSSHLSSWRHSIRLPTYDYTEPGAYFVTICAHERELLFSDPWVKMVVERAWRSVTGRLAAACDFVVMPNHIHGIIWLTESRRPTAQHSQDLRFCDNKPSRVSDVASAKVGAARLRRNVAPASLGAKVRPFKAASARRINARRGTPGAPLWQPDYYEHIIRNDADLNRIRQYILDNPAKWADDPENPSIHTAPT